MRWVSLVIGAACGRYEFGPRADAGADAALLDFSTPLHQPALGSPQSEDDPTATGDALELYFMSSRTGSTVSSIYVAKRSSRGEPWSAPQLVTELDSPEEDQSPGVSSDGLTIYFSSRRPSPLGGANSNIWMATRTSRDAAWGTPSFVAELSTSLDEFEPQPDETNLRLVLYRHLSTNNRDIYEATRAAATDSWGAPQSLGAVNDGVTDERSPCLRSDGRELWFTSDRNTPGTMDIFIATRTSSSELFPAGDPAPSINSAASDDDPWVSPDGRVLIFSSSRDGTPELYEAQR